MQCHLSNISDHCGRLITVTSSHQRNLFTSGRTYSVAFGITSREEPTLSHHLMYFPSLGLISMDMIIWIMHDENIKFGLPKMGTFWKYLSALFSDLPSSHDTIWVNSCSFGYFDIFSYAWRQRATQLQWRLFGALQMTQGTRLHIFFLVW